jgi:glycosyltransferase involved in cell wall biosynthesis
MRLAVHDYCGHPFQVQLSRELARRGHEVLHLYCDSVSAAHGALEVRPGDPPTFAVRAISLDRPFAKYSFARRLGQEREYGGHLAAALARFRPDAVLSGNTPLLAQRAVVDWSRRNRVRFVFWQQDALGVGIRNVLARRYGRAGRAVGTRFVALEGRLLRDSAAVVAITEDFKPVLEAHGVSPSRVVVIENWAPLDEVTVEPRVNRWSREHGLADCPVVLYAGTLGLKHNPDLLLQLALSLRAAGDPTRVVVVSEGLGADWLRERAGEHGLTNLTLLGFQPWDDLPLVLGSADIVVAVLEHDAGVFSVPSKVMSYYCAGRPLVAAFPAENLAARVVGRTGAGVVVDPRDAGSFVSAVRSMLADPGRREACASRARAYAEATFDIGLIGARFERVLTNNVSATEGARTSEE